MQYSVHHVPCVHMTMILSHFLAAVIKINSKHLLQLVLGKKFCGGDLYYKTSCPHCMQKIVVEVFPYTM